MVRAQAAMELRLILRNGEQLLLNLIIPVLLTVVLVLEPFIDINGAGRPGFFVPGVLALAIMSAAFTGQAIATGFERKYGVLKRLGVTALPRSALLTGKTGAIACLEIIQVAVICLVGVAVGWRPHGNPLSVIVLIVLGTAAFSGLALLIAGTLRAEATLAAANLVWFVLLFLGDVVFPLSKFPAGVANVLRLLPTSALAHGLRSVLHDGTALPVRDLLTLAVWAVVALAAAARYFRWE
ncbi:MAG TPA: ABC transporter permease [Mycobacteriales bacterium]|nr:ABC transporter permease [Mycobacteriales bacterium]